MGWKRGLVFILSSLATIALGFWLQPRFQPGSAHWLSVAAVFGLITAALTYDMWLPQTRAKWLRRRRSGRAVGDCLYLDWNGLHDGLAQITPYLEFRYRVINSELETVQLTAVRGHVTLDGQEVGTPELKKGNPVEIRQGGSQEVYIDLRPAAPQATHIRDVKSRNPREQERDKPPRYNFAGVRLIVRGQVSGEISEIQLPNAALYG